MSDKAAGQKTRSPEGCDENGPAAALLVGYVSIQICALLAPCRRPILIAMAPAKAPRAGMVLKVTNKEPKGAMDETTSKRKPLPRPGGKEPARKGLTNHHKRALAGNQK